MMFCKFVDVDGKWGKGRGRGFYIYFLTMIEQ